MRTKLIHRNTHVYDLDATLAFYEKALGLTERRRKGPEDGSWLIVFIGNDESDFELELTWNNGFEGTYDNGNGDTHVAVRVDDYDAFHALHEEMGCIVKENPLAAGSRFFAALTRYPTSATAYASQADCLRNARSSHE